MSLIDRFSQILEDSKREYEEAKAGCFIVTMVYQPVSSRYSFTPLKRYGLNSLLYDFSFGGAK